MANLVEWIEDAFEGEAIEGVVIGEMGWGDCGSERVPNYAGQPRGKLISWEDARKLLDYEFYDGYGSPECNAVYAWSATRIFIISKYDGATSWHTIPRHPSDCMPEMFGGG